MNQEICEQLVTSLHGVEAAIILSAQRVPLWYSRKTVAMESLLQTIQSVTTIAHEQHLFTAAPGISLTIDTSFGALHIRSIDDNNLLVLCLLRGYSLQTINTILDTTVITHF